MLKRIIAGAAALAFVVGASACGPREETAAVDEPMDTWVAPADTATLGVPGGTLGTTPDTLPPTTTPEPYTP